MTETVVVKGRLVTPSTAQLEEPLSGVADDVQVVAHPPNAVGANFEQLIARLLARPDGAKTREELDEEIRQQREGWE